MSGVLSFLDIDGIEVANAYRTLSYLSRGLGALNWEVPSSYPCAILAREIGGNAPFVSPALDPAPWYDATVPESAEFLGFVPRLNFQAVTVKRSVSQRFGGVGGGVIGVEQVSVRALKVQGMLIASSCAGLEYGRHWLYSQVGADCAGCSLGTVRVRESCPPDNGSNDTRGEKILYDAALIDGIDDVGDGGDFCCDYDEISFTIASESPYLYSRPGAATAPVVIGNSGGLAPVPPAVLDTFVRANTGPPPSVSWTGPILTSDGNTLRVLSNVLDNSVHTPGTVGSAYWNAAAFPADHAVTVVCTTRVNSGQFELRARIQNPNLATATYVAARVIFSAAPGGDTVQLLRVDGTLGLVWFKFGTGGQTFANGDTFMLTCRGNLIEMWRKPSGGAWIRLASAYDAITPAVNRIGVAIIEQGATQTLGAFGGGTLTNGAAYPVDPVIVTIPATSIGITSPIITLTNAYGLHTPIGANAVRFQLKQYARCSETDDFAVNDLATNWYLTSGWTITGGKLKPTSTGTRRQLLRTYTGAAAGAVAYLGGRVEATVKLGATLTSGQWGVGFANIANAYLLKASNTFVIAACPGCTPFDTLAFTPVAGTTYRIILEYLPLNDGSGNIDVRGYLVDQAAPGVMLTRPLRGTIASTAPVVVPGIDSLPADTAEEWDSFYAVDTADSPQYMEANIPSGVLVVDGGRRVTQFTPTGTAVSQEGSGYISTPLDTPLGWPDVCAGSGQGCLEILASEVAWPADTSFTVALQQRVR